MSWGGVVRLAVLSIGLFWMHVGVSLGESAEALRSRMVETAKGSAIDDVALKPWHLKLTVEPAPGSNGETAMVEEWWAGPKRYRILVTSPSYTATELRNDDGTFYAGDPGQIPEVIERMRKEVVHPMPEEQEIVDAKLEERSDSMGSWLLTA